MLIYLVLFASIWKTVEQTHEEEADILLPGGNSSARMVSKETTSSVNSVKSHSVKFTRNLSFASYAEVNSEVDNLMPVRSISVA